ncbi:MAG TPA: ROK family protein [Draconibacterium sp.]|nr:ROK family protein [Draconibacterium sp.]
MKIIGVDVGGTKIGAALIEDGVILKEYNCPTPFDQNKEVVISALSDATSEVFSDEVAGIGIGVPGLVDLETNEVLDVVNIPSWDRVSLKSVLENHFKKPVFVNNDANCFAVGEKYFGEGKPFHDFVGLTMGTGMGAGIVINDHLYSGRYCGAGEFGMIYYRDSIVEAYASGQFFSERQGGMLAEKAASGNAEAKQLFYELGIHIGRAIANILYALAPEAIILGGSVSRSFPFFEEGMHTVLQNEFAFQRLYRSLTIKVSTLDNSALLGAASLVLDAIPSKK